MSADIIRGFTVDEKQSDSSLFYGKLDRNLSDGFYYENIYTCGFFSYMYSTVMSKISYYKA